MHAKDKSFLKTIVKNAEAAGFAPPFVLTQFSFSKAVSAFYEYGTEKSTKEKMQMLVKEGLFEIGESGFKVSDTALKIARQN